LSLDFNLYLLSIVFPSLLLFHKISWDYSREKGMCKLEWTTIVITSFFFWDHNVFQVKCFLNFMRKDQNILFLYNLFRCNPLISIFFLKHQMGDFLMCVTFTVIIHKEQVNGFTMIIVCNDEYIIY
jgi:hypothetical protein